MSEHKTETCAETSPVENHANVNAVSQPEMDIEEGFESANSCGKFQALLQFIVMYLILATGYQGLFSYFIFDDPHWQCATRNDTRNYCATRFNLTFPNNNDERCNMRRHEWEYVTKNTYSAVTEFDLVCANKALAATSSSSLYIGGLIGVIAAGKAGDSFGRKPVMLVCLLCSISLSIGCSFVSQIWQLTVLRGFLGAFYVSYFTISYVFLMEYIAPKYRTACGIMFNTMFPLSLILMTGAAYAERNWRHLTVFGSLPAILALAALFFMPESPRWLLAMQRNGKAVRNLKRVAAFNGRDLANISLKTSITAVNTNYSYFDLMRYGKVALITSSQGLLWLTSALIYYTLGLESSSLGGDMYAVFIYSQLAEIPSNIVTIFCCDYFGRKKTILGSLTLGGLLTALIPLKIAYHATLYKLILAILAKFFITVTYNGTYVWAFEVFPTVVRSQGVCVCSIMERIGGQIAPYLVNVLSGASASLPYVIMGVLAALSSLIGLAQPETNRMPTRELFDEFFEKPCSSNFDDEDQDTKIEEEMGAVNPLYETTEEKKETSEV